VISGCTKIMTLDLKNDALPLAIDESGTIRVAGTRVTLDVLLAFYKQGQSADDLARGFPSVPLADIHAVIAYYLRRRSDVDAYLAERGREADELRGRIGAHQGPGISRDELLRRREQRPGRRA
jgi:uncharacterized protein (DUF433 family)